MNKSLKISLLAVFGVGLVSAFGIADQKTYESKCAGCHGKDGKGNPAMVKMFKADPAALDLVDEATLKKTDEELIKETTDGKNKMPSFKGKLPDKSIADTIAYVRSLKKEK